MTHTHVAAYPLSPPVRDRPQVAHPPAPGLQLLRFAAVMAMLLAAAAFLQSSFLTVLDAMRVLAALPEGEVTRGLRLRVDRAGSVMLTTVDDVTVLLGAPPGLIGRIVSLPQVLSAIRRQGLGVRYVDLRFAGSVILKQGAPPSRGGVRH